MEMKGRIPDPNKDSKDYATNSTIPVENYNEYIQNINKLPLISETIVFSLCFSRFSPQNTVDHLNFASILFPHATYFR